MKPQKLIRAALALNAIPPSPEEEEAILDELVFRGRLMLSLLLVMLEHSSNSVFIPASRKSVSFHRCFLL